MLERREAMNRIWQKMKEYKDDKVLCVTLARIHHHLDNISDDAFERSLYLTMTGES